jgi:hypothetical protein
MGREGESEPGLAAMFAHVLIYRMNIAKNDSDF